MKKYISLNPCFNGRCTRTKSKNKKAALSAVLILVLMEDALALKEIGISKPTCEGLNPCFNGRCTRTLVSTIQKHLWKYVLILVLMEDALARTRTVFQRRRHVGRQQKS